MRTINEMTIEEEGELYRFFDDGQRLPEGTPDSADWVLAYIRDNGYPF